MSNGHALPKTQTCEFFRPVLYKISGVRPQPWRFPEGLFSQIHNKLLESTQKYKASVMVRNLILGTVFVLLVVLAGYTVLFKPDGSNFGPSSKRTYGHGGNFRN